MDEAVRCLMAYGVGMKSKETKTKRDAREIALSDLQEAKKTYGPTKEVFNQRREYLAIAWKAVELNLPLIHWVLRPVRGKDSYDDLVAELTLTLFNACANWEGAKGPFSTYAVACIKTSYLTISSELHQLDNPIRMPNGLQTELALQTLKKQIDERVRPLRKSYERAEATERLGYWWMVHGKESKSVETLVKKYRAAEQGIKSKAKRSRRFSDEDGIVYNETEEIHHIVDTYAPLLEDGAETMRLQEVLGGYLSQFDAREAHVIRARFGLGDPKNEEISLRMVGKHFGVTPERIRQIESRAIRKIRTSPDIHILRSFILEPSDQVQVSKIVVTDEENPLRVGQQETLEERTCALIAHICRRQVHSSQYKRLSATLHRLFKTISVREAYVVRLRFGIQIAAGKGMTQKDIADMPEMGITESRISAIQKRAIKKLRHPSRAGLLRQILMETYKGE